MGFISNAFGLALVLLTISFGWLNDLSPRAQVAQTVAWAVSVAGFASFRLFGMVTKAMAGRARRKATATAARAKLRVVDGGQATRSPVNLAS